MTDFFYNQQISARSSFVGHVNATTEGLPTIRCAKVENILIDEFDSHQNLYTSASYLYLCWFRALAFIEHIYFIFFTSAILLQFLIFDTGTKIFFGENYLKNTLVF
jgi:ATP-binding cassette subfamily C (CFTR/MRP) protein 4